MISLDSRHMMNLKMNGWTNGTKEYHGFLRNRGRKMEFPLITSIIFASLSISRMGKLNGPLAIQMMKGSAMEENYRGWCFRNFHELDYELLVKLEEYWWKMNDHEYVSRTFSNHEEREPNDDHGVGNLDNDLVQDNASYHANDEEYEEDRCELLGNPRQEPPVSKIKRFEMIKYSFGPAEKYVAIKECEYDDLTRTEDDACHAYQEIFRIMGKGWFVTRAE
ncbi:hypothetical protein Tco_1543892 [Tanacetum coccineum]